MITRCNWVLGFFDNLEEERPLFLPERNFRKLVKNDMSIYLRPNINTEKIDAPLDG
jgi:hypothetical protein